MIASNDAGDMGITSQDIAVEAGFTSPARADVAMGGDRVDIG
jgi:hypothetical protein